MSSPSNATTDSAAAAAATTAAKASLMSLIICLALFGNALVVTAVLRFRRLRSAVTNAFIVSLASADFLIALLVMPMNAMQSVTGGWPLGRFACDVFNSNDVLFSTASTLHLCCIGTERYIAITDPFEHERRMSRRRVAAMIAASWLASLLISYLPVHSGIYATPEHRRKLSEELTVCVFEVNRPYALISSVVSFWIPCITMAFVYARIFGEARRQEQQIYRMAQLQQRGADSSKPLLQDGSGGSSDRRKMKKEHKAAKTLSIIMGCFIACWVPFFCWYTVTQAICRSCWYPEQLVECLFWIGYLNSALNPLIYAFFNREFRRAFHRLLRLNRLCRWSPEEDPLTRTYRPPAAGRMSTCVADSQC